MSIFRKKRRNEIDLSRFFEQKFEKNKNKKKDLTLVKQSQ